MISRITSKRLKDLVGLEAAEPGLYSLKPGFYFLFRHYLSFWGLARVKKMMQCSLMSRLLYLHSQLSSLDGPNISTRAGTNDHQIGISGGSVATARRH